MSMSHIRPYGTPIVDQIQENMLAYFRLFVGLPGITVADENVFWLINAQAGPGNHILRTQLPSTAVASRIDAIFDQIGQYTDQIDWLVFPSCQPTDLGKRLEARGMIGGPGGIWMLANLASEPSPRSVPEGFRTEFARNAEMLDAWKRVSSEGFGHNAQIYYDAYARHDVASEAVSLHYLGYRDDQPVTSGTLLLAGGIAGIWDVSTPPTLRGQGFGSALTLTMMQEAHARGYRQAWVWSSAIGKGVYGKIGFVAADFGIREYQWRKR
jgi:GNAT superfamily N-acetyltransferase